MQQIPYAGPSNDATIFADAGDRVCLRRLCGATCGNDGEDTGPAMTQGPAILATNLGRFEGGDFKLVDRRFDAETARLVWSAAGGALRLESAWAFCPQTGVVSRKDRLLNSGSDPATVFRLQSRFAFPPGRYEVYAQQSRWCNENQGKWISLHAGSLRFGCVQGRTTQGGTPYLCLREIDSGRGLAFHVLPCGNWSIEATARAVMDGHPFAVVNLGLAADDLRLELAPGASLECPEVLIQSLPGGEPSAAAPRLHRWLRKRVFAAQRSEMPVVYNTWFDQFEVLDAPRLRRQLQAAKDVGCEVFVIDAGWYGPQAGDWFAQAGDWREKTDGAFRGAMAAFAEEVRAAGLGFGLWMEPERFGPDVPIRRERPEWFRPGQPPFARIALENPAACAYLRDEISRLVATYRLAWMKIDFNFELGLDASGCELSGYYRAWHRLLDEARLQHPRTVFEGCASGAMRLDLASLSHFDGQFLSDTVNPVDVLRIWQGALLRLPPGQLIKWAVVRSIGQTIPRYTKSLADSPTFDRRALRRPLGALGDGGDGFCGGGGPVGDFRARRRSRRVARRRPRAAAGARRFRQALAAGNPPLRRPFPDPACPQDRPGGLDCRPTQRRRERNRLPLRLSTQRRLGREAVFPAGVGPGGGLCVDVAHAGGNESPDRPRRGPDGGGRGNHPARAASGGSDRAHKGSGRRSPGEDPAMKEMPVSLYWIAEWWDSHCHCAKPRPTVPSQSGLEELYLGRLRFLFEEFGQFGIGEEKPVLGPGQIATVIRYGFELVPALLGTRYDFADAWGFFPRLRRLEEVRGLEPVDVRNHREGEWIVRRKEEMVRLYGGATHCVDIAGVVNHAFRILGQDIYADLLDHPAEVRALFEVILQTMRGVYDLLDDVFGNMDPVPMGNCNVTMMGTALYEQSVLEFDARQNRFAADRRPVPPRAALHHCDVPVDRFIESYARLPGLASLQASFESDVAAVKRRLPACAFSAMISPRVLQKDLAAFRDKLDRAVAAGADDLAVWNIDPATDPDRLRRIFAIIGDICRQHNRSAKFDAMPLCWEEMEWAHARYQPQAAAAR